MGNKKKENFSELVHFRCTTEKALHQFLHNCGSRGWSKDDVLRSLVDSFNAMFEHGRKPELPLRVVDANEAKPESDILTQEGEALIRKLTERFVTDLLAIPNESVSYGPKEPRLARKIVARELQRRGK